MNTMIIPALLSIVGINTNFMGAIQKSVNVFQNADKQATSKANELVDVFGSIFK